MRILKEIHLYPTWGFNQFKFYDTESYIRDFIGDPFVKIQKPKEPFTLSIYNGGNLLLWFTKDTRRLTRIQYDINQPSKTRFYLMEDAVSPYTPNILRWFQDRQIPHESIGDYYVWKELCTELYTIPIYIQKSSKRILIELNPS